MGALTDAKVRAAKGTGKPFKLSDGQQLYLHVSAVGGRSWRMNYQFGRSAQGKPMQKTLTIGAYPAISLREAREARDMAKAMLAKGIEPKPADLFQRGAPVADTRPRFEAVGRQWLKLQEKRWSKVHAKDVHDSLEADVFPALGTKPVAELDEAAVFEVLQPIVERGAIETAHRIRQRISAICIYAVAKGEALRDPAAQLGLALPRKPKAKAQPAITSLPGLRQLLVDCDAERCRAPTKFALRLIALTAVRPNELHGARWHEFEGLDGPEPLWRIPASRMKGDRDRKREEDGDHLVPLAPEAVAVIDAVRQVNGDLPLVFPSDRHSHRPMSENTINAALRRLGYASDEMTAHGFRAMASTLLNESGKWHPDAIERALAHGDKDKVRAAYHRGAHWQERVEMALWWSDYLDQLRKGADVLRFPERTAV